MQSILKRVLSGVAVASALGAMAAVNVDEAQAYNATCAFIPGVTNVCPVVSPANPLVTAASTWYVDGLGFDFLGAFDQFIDPGANVACRGRVTYAIPVTATTKTTVSTAAGMVNTKSAYVLGAPTSGPNEGYFPEAGIFPVTTQIMCP